MIKKDDENSILKKEEKWSKKMWGELDDDYEKHFVKTDFDGQHRIHQRSTIVIFFTKKSFERMLE